MPKTITLLSVFLLAASCASPFVAGQTTTIQQYDIAEIMMKKYVLSVDQNDFVIFYRLSTAGTISEDTHEDLDAKITSIEVNQERLSLLIKLSGVNQADIMSLRVPNGLISAEGKQLSLFVDGKQTQYEWSVKGENNNLIFIVPNQTADLELVGTRVIPEFPSGLPMLIVALSAIATVPFLRYAYS